MSHSHANNLVEDPQNDLDPTGEDYIHVIPEPNRPTILPATSPSVGFNSSTLTLTQNNPVRLVGHDPARLRMLLNISANADVLIGDQSTVSIGQGFNLTNHNAGGSIEINTTEEVWVVSTGVASLQIYVWVERSVS